MRTTSSMVSCGRSGLRRCSTAASTALQDDIAPCRARPRRRSDAALGRYTQGADMTEATSSTSRSVGEAVVIHFRPPAVSSSILSNEPRHALAVAISITLGDVRSTTLLCMPLGRMEQHVAREQSQLAESYRFIVAVERLIEIGSILVVDAPSWSMAACIAMDPVEKRDNSIRRLRGQRCLPELQSGGEGIAAVGSHTVVIAKFAQALIVVDHAADRLLHRFACLRRIGMVRGNRSDDKPSLSELRSVPIRSAGWPMSASNGLADRFDQCLREIKSKVGDTLHVASMASICCSIGSVIGPSSIAERAPTI